MRAFVDRTDHSTAPPSSSRKSGSGETISDTESSDKSTVYRPGPSPNKVQQVDEDGGVRAKNYTNVQPIGNNTTYMGTRYTAEENLWHILLGHTMPLVTVRKQLNDGLLPHAKCRKSYCEPCAKGKYRRRFRGSLTSTVRIGRLHCYTKGQVNFISDDGHKYLQTIVKEHLRLVSGCPMRSKSEASEIVLRFVKRFEKQSGYKVPAIRTDNGTEFSRAFTSLTDDGVICTTNTADISESNGLAEQTHQKL